MESSKTKSKKLVSVGGPRDKGQSRANKDVRIEGQVENVDDGDDAGDAPAVNKTVQSRALRRQTKAPAKEQENEDVDPVWKVKERRRDKAQQSNSDHLYDVDEGTEGDEEVEVTIEDEPLDTRRKGKGATESRSTPQGRGKRQPAPKAKAAAESPISGHTQRSKGKRQRTTTSNDSDYETEDDQDTIEELQNTVANKKQRREQKKHSKQDCLRAMVDLKTPGKLPPRRLTKEDFAREFNLSSAGVNPHKLKIGKHVSEKDMEEVFGSDRGRNGYSIGLKLSDQNPEKLESLYCVVYQKEAPPSFVAKELAMGWFYEHVRGKEVDWAEFAAETNNLQQQNYKVRVRMWLTRLQAAGDKNVEVDRDVDVFLKRADGGPVLAAGGFKRPLAVLLHGQDRKPSSLMPSLDFDMLSNRSADMDGVVSKVQDKVAVLQEECDDMKKTLFEVDKDCDFCLGMVGQLVKQFAKYGEEFAVPNVDDEDFVMDVAGDGPMHDMLRNNVVELRNLLKKKRSLQRLSDELVGRLQGSQRYLKALQSYQDSLHSGELNCIMHPNPMPVAASETECMADHGVFPLPSVCAVCSEGFPFWHALICSCRHFYHPWCAASWFRDSSDCAAANCGRVHPMWLKACGFSSVCKEDGSGATGNETQSTGEAAAGFVSHSRESEPQKNRRRPLTISEGAGTASASGSMFSKCVTDVGDKGRILVGQRASQTWTSELSVRDLQMTPGSTQSQVPNFEPLSQGFKTVNTVLYPEETEKDKNKAAEEKSNEDDTVVPMSSPLVPVDIRTEEEHAEKAVLETKEDAAGKIQKSPVRDDAGKITDAVGIGHSKVEEQLEDVVNDGDMMPADEDVIATEKLAEQEPAGEEHEGADFLTAEEQAVLHAVPVPDTVQLSKIDNTPLRSEEGPEFAHIPSGDTAEDPYLLSLAECEALIADDAGLSLSSTKDSPKRRPLSPVVYRSKNASTDKKGAGSMKAPAEVEKIVVQLEDDSSQENMKEASVEKTNEADTAQAKEAMVEQVKEVSAVSGKGKGRSSKAQASSPLQSTRVLRKTKQGQQQSPDSTAVGGAVAPPPKKSKVGKRG